MAFLLPAVSASSPAFGAEQQIEQKVNDLVGKMTIAEKFGQLEAVAADEAAADGLNWTFAPMLDLSRDPRWGRIIEGSGEDPFLGSAMAAAKVQGFQGRDFSGPTKVATLSSTLLPTELSKRAGNTTPWTCRMSASATSTFRPTGPP